MVLAHKAPLKEGDLALPAIEKANGDKMWCLNGEFHRDCS